MGYNKTEEDKNLNNASLSIRLRIGVNINLYFIRVRNGFLILWLRAGNVIQTEYLLLSPFLADA